MSLPDQSLATNEDQALIRESALQFLGGQQPIESLRALRDSEDPAGVSDTLWDEASALGWPGLLVAEEWGGADMGFQELGVIMEVLGRYVTPTPLFSSGVLAASAITLVDGWADLPKTASLATGTQRFALALEESPRFAPNRIETVARADGDGFVLSGRKRPVLDGAAADEILVVARLEEGSDSVGLFRVAPGQVGVESTTLKWIDGRRATDLVLSDVRVDASARVGQPLPIARLIEPLVDRAAAALAAELVGVTAEAFSQTVEYLKTRVQFDQTLAEFQALQHRCAHMFADIERTISVVQAALRALDESDAEASMLASAAKAMASETARHVTEEALQLFGGLGMTEEQDIGLYFKRARTSAELFGNSAYHYRRYARLNGF